MQKLSLPVRLVLLVAGTMLPLIILATAVIFRNYEKDREEATKHVLETARGIRLTLDAEMRRMTGGLQVLALTNALRDGDFKSFSEMASGFLDQYGKNGVILVETSAGQPLFASSTPTASALPPPDDHEIVEQVFATRLPQYSNTFFGPAKDELALSVEVPVFRDNQVVYDISFSPPLAIFQSLVETQRPSPDWTVALVDGKGLVFACTPHPEATLGGHATVQPTTADESTLSATSLEGERLIMAVARSPLTGWTVEAGIAESSLIAPLRRNLMIASAVAGMLLLTGLAFAARMATTIARGEMLHDLLIDELNHRVKNTLAILQGIALQTFRSATTDEREKFQGRMGALAEAHNLLGNEKWQGSGLKDVLQRVLQPYRINDPDRIRLAGPPAPLSPRPALVLSMIVHEMATNAAKYGALSNDAGTVSVDWEILPADKGSKLRLTWTESGGPPVAEPVARGFGSRLIERGARQLGGEASVDFRRRGVTYTMTCPLEQAG